MSQIIQFIESLSYTQTLLIVLTFAFLSLILDKWSKKKNKDAARNI